MTDQFIGELRIFPYDFSPRGWAFCDGQLLAINQNQALFALIGTTYGGNGVTNFALPDLRGRTPMHVGPERTWGQRGGSETETLSSTQMPPHGHSAKAQGGAGNEVSPGGHYWAGSGRDELYGTAPGAPLAGTAMLPAGGNQPHENRPPYLVVPVSIALVGIFPSRN